MSQARPIHPNTTYLITRRCTQRLFLLKPDAAALQLFLYAIAVATTKTGVLVHAVVVMSNHWHAVVTDVNGNLPVFSAEVHRTVARARNAMLGRTENFWSSDKTGTQVLPELVDIVDRIAYVFCNPVAAGAVESPLDWPGLICAEFGKTFDVTRPQVFFRDNGPMPETASLTITAPDAADGVPVEEVQRLVDAAIAARLDGLRAMASQEAKRFAGAEACASESSDRAGTTREAIGERNPRVSCSRREKRLEVIERLRQWARGYREAWQRWKSGLREVLFPDGTYHLRVHHGVACSRPEWTGW